jgi:hypothetical protein
MTIDRMAQDGIDALVKNSCYCPFPGPETDRPVPRRVIIRATMNTRKTNPAPIRNPCQKSLDM